MRPIYWATIYVTVIVGAILLAHYFSQTVTTMVESAPIQRTSCYIIDAGHGGIDTGATSCSGVPESHINLQISFRIKDLLHLLGYDTKMVRTTDTSVYTQGNTIAAQKVSDLKNRVELVNNTEGAILVSIHQNTYPDQRYRGPQVFYANCEISKNLAQCMQSELIRNLQPDSKRSCKEAKGIYLMSKINRPGILIECGFLTNPEEDALLNRTDYQQKLAAVIATTLVNTPTRGVSS